MRRCNLAVAALCLAMLACAAEAYKHGDGTAYSGYKEKDETGKNSCGFGRLANTWERYYAALPSQVFDRERDCGKCIRARGTEKGAPGDWVKVMIVDECASCPGDGDVDFSTDALKAITGYSWDRKRIEWEWTSCDDDDSSKDGSDKNNSNDSSSDDSDSKNSSNRRLLQA